MAMTSSNNMLLAPPRRSFSVPWPKRWRSKAQPMRKNSNMNPGAQLYGIREIGVSSRVGAMEILAQKLDEQCPSSKFQYDDDDTCVDDKDDDDAREGDDEFERRDNGRLGAIFRGGSNKPVDSTMTTTINSMPQRAQQHQQSFVERNATFSPRLVEPQQKQQGSSFLLRPALPSKGKPAMPPDKNKQRLILSHRGAAPDEALTPPPRGSFILTGTRGKNSLLTMAALADSDSNSSVGSLMDETNKPKRRGVVDPPSNFFRNSARNTNTTLYEQRDEEEEITPRPKGSSSSSREKSSPQRLLLGRNSRKSMQEEVGDDGYESPQIRKLMMSFSSTQQEDALPSRKPIVLQPSPSSTARKESLSLSKREDQDHTKLKDAQATKDNNRNKGPSRAQQLLQKRIGSNAKFGAPPHTAGIRKPLRANVIRVGQTV
jgi:hypothetical protein